MSRNLDTDAESEAYTLDSLFERSLTKYSERDAVSYDGETYSYAELDERSNALANALVDRGVS
ncbi:MAG: hypothetical protein SV760_01955, partial [Halobacteria archaeon]|nr:hypothetical protein [Halobacteria archaeon]